VTFAPLTVTTYDIPSAWGEEKGTIARGEKVVALKKKGNPI